MRQACVVIAKDCWTVPNWSVALSRYRKIKSLWGLPPPRVVLLIDIIPFSVYTTPDSWGETVLQ